MVDLSSVMILLALQLLALGWRLSREIAGVEPHRYPWVPIPDNVNVLAMLAVLSFCIVAPMTITGIRLYAVGVMARATFAAACVLMVAHPVVVASHYRIWSGSRHAEGDETEEGSGYCTRQEVIVQVVALVAAALVFMWVLEAANAPRVILPSE